MNQLLNPDFDLDTFYWQYATVANDKTVYTVECFYRDNKHAFLVVQSSAAHHNVMLLDATVDSRVVEAVTKHFSQRYMLEDGQLMVIEYANGASDQLKRNETYGQAIFGMDLEEAYEDQNLDSDGIPL